MFIPADGLYQDLLNSRVGTLQINSRDLVSYAYTKKVMIVSPEFIPNATNYGKGSSQLKSRKVY